MHMPGHKRNVALLGGDLPYSVDVTEIDGADDLHDPEDGGIIGSLCEKYADLYDAKSLTKEGISDRSTEYNKEITPFKCKFSYYLLQSVAILREICYNILISKTEV